MKIRGRVKWIIAAAAVCVLLALVLFSGYVLTAGGRQEFPLDGYILEITDSEEGAVCSPRSFRAGEKAREKFPDSWQYKDTEGRAYAASRDSFLHFEDGSLSSFRGGTLVDVEASGSGVLEFYHIEPMMIMGKASSGWTIDNNSKNLEFKELLWAVTQERLLAASDKMELTLSSGEKKSVSGYLEFQWLDEGILQITDGEEIWRTLSSGTRIRFSSGMNLDLGEKLVYDRDGNAGFTLADLSADQDLAVNLNSGSADWSGWTPPTFIIHNDDGEDGTAGVRGEDGQEGDQGKEGEKGQNGKNGEGGAAGGQASGVIAGEETNLASESMARILITDISGTGANTAFTIKVKDTNHTLTASSGVISVREVPGGAVVWTQNVDLTSIDSQTFRINDGSLKDDMQYTITIESGYQLNMESGITNTGTMAFATRDFYTASDGLCLDRTELTQENMTIYLGKTGSTSISNVKIKVKTANGEYETNAFNPGAKTSYTIEYMAEIVEAWGFRSVDGIANQPFTVELYLDRGTGQYEKSPYELSGTFLKKEPSFEGLYVTKRNGYYEFQERLIADRDQALESCRFVITQDGVEIKSLTTSGTTVQWYYDEGLGGAKYAVTVYMTWNDNQITVERKMDTKEFIIPDSKRLSASWEDSGTTHGTYISGKAILQAHGTCTIPADQVVTVTLAKKDGSWKKTSYVNLKGCVSKDHFEINLKYDTDLEEDTEYILTIKGILQDKVEDAAGNDVEQKSVEILLREKVKAKTK